VIGQRGGRHAVLVEASAHHRVLVVRPHATERVLRTEQSAHEGPAFRVPTLIARAARFTRRHAATVGERRARGVCACWAPPRPETASRLASRAGSK
jgi:hypothetical protein